MKVEPATMDLPSRASNALADEPMANPWGRFLRRVLVSGSPAGRAVESMSAREREAARPEAGTPAEAVEGLPPFNE